MKERDVDETFQVLVHKMEMTTTADLVEMAYDLDASIRFSPDARSLSVWNRFSTDHKKLLRKGARKLWEETIAESWLTQNGIGSLAKSLREDAILSIRGIWNLHRAEVFSKKLRSSGLAVSDVLDHDPSMRHTLHLSINNLVKEAKGVLREAAENLPSVLNDVVDRDIDENVEGDDEEETDVVRAIQAYQHAKWREFMIGKTRPNRWWRFLVFFGTSILGLFLGRPFLRFLLLGRDSMSTGSASTLLSTESVFGGHPRLFDALTLNFPSSTNSSVKWEFENPSIVGKTFSFQVSLFKYGGVAFPIDEWSLADWVTIEILANETVVLHTVSFSTSPSPLASLATTPATTPTAPSPTPTAPEAAPPAAALAGSGELSTVSKRSSPPIREALPNNVVRVSFTVHQAADYAISVKIRNRHVAGSPFQRSFLPGPLDLVKTSLSQQSPLITCGQQCALELAIQPRDRYNNKCTVNEVDGSRFTLSVSSLASNKPSSLSSEIIPVSCVFERDTNRLNITAYPEKTGIFHVTLAHLLQPLVNCSFHLVVLPPNLLNQLEANVSKQKHNLWYEAQFLDLENPKAKPRKVYVYITPRQLTVKEFYLKIFPKRLFTFRVCPSTRMDFGLAKQYSNPHIFSIDDGNVNINLVSKDRDMLVGTFARFLLKNIGGSETFKDKRDFFNAELMKHHKLLGRGRFQITLSRSPDLLASAYRSLKSASTTDWCKLFEFSFVGEEGLDYGGLRREAFNQIFKIIFQTESGLFSRFSDDQHGAVHPSPADRRAPDLKTKYFEFAGKLVGKCLFESAQGLVYALNVNARFSRSFLAQLIGLRVNFKYFEQDDPEFYVSKIKFILENNLDDPNWASETGLDDLTFSEEIYDNRGQLIKIIDLIPNGRHIRVNNSNKKKYLDCLAQHRFVNSVSSEIEAFMKGLNELVPDSLLSIFDERELELLLCGIGKIDMDDFRKNTMICSSSSFMFSRVVEWFWTVVSSFGQDELALLLQFASGSSQLPPRGFAELRPKFQISHSPAAYNSLPTAHTCFNQLCLPDYEDCATLHRMLLLAIHEGSQGFAFA